MKILGIIYLTSVLCFHTKASQLSLHPASSSSSGRGGRVISLDISTISDADL